MLVERAAYSWASAEDIPGSRCGPEDGPWPRPYQVLDEPEIWRELRSLAKPQSVVLEGDAPQTRKGMRVDSVNFQPSLKTRTQDRYVVRDLEIQGRMWSLTGVFDGHLGDVTVEHVAYHLPVIIQDFIGDALKSDPTCLSNPELIADYFARSIEAFDDTLAQDVLDLFGGLEGLELLSDSEIRNLVNDQHEGGANWKRVRLCMYGTTALVALVDPDRENLWVANLGDCQAVMVSQNRDGRGWTIDQLTAEHNGNNDAEIERVQRAHPDEPECIVDRRVLGALAPTRCIGDIAFKQPPVFTRRILYNLFPGFVDTAPWEEFLVRNRTPPYIDTLPEVTHRRLRGGSDYDDPSAHTCASPLRFLILSSDGFTDLCSGAEQRRVLVRWAEGVVASSKDHLLQPSNGEKQKQDNMALRLLWWALGGEDRYKVSRVLTLDMDVAWIDDTAIVVQTL